MNTNPHEQAQTLEIFDKIGTAVAERSGDTAFRAGESGVALRFLPQSKLIASLYHPSLIFRYPELRSPPRWVH